MRRGSFVRQARARAKSRDVAWRMVRHGAEHEIWMCGPVMVAIPRHRELTAGVVGDVRHKLERVLGRDWWK